MVCVCVGGCLSVLNINGKYSSLQLSENTADQRVKNKGALYFCIMYYYGVLLTVSH